MTMPRVAFLGAGHMGRAIIAALLRAGFRAEDIRVGEPLATARDALARDFGVAASDDNAAALAQADIVVLAVKPQDMGQVLAPLSAPLRARKPVVLSIAAGIRVADLQRWCGTAIAIVRAMPNRPALVGAGATGLFADADVPAAARALAERVMRSCGSVVWVPREELIDAVTALSGSGPAYFFLLAEAMAQAGVELGLTADAAQQLAIATLHGAGLMAAQSDGDLAKLRAEVTSKGGTTAAALQVFDDAGVRVIVARALAAAAERGRTLAAQFGASQPRTPQR
jgi:pyrroline-5-carboxylate reductase